MEIPSHVSFYSGFTIWIINCTIWPAGIGRRSLNLRRAERELGGGSAQCERKNPTQRNKSPRFVISHQLSIPLFFPPQLISSQLISPCPPPTRPRFPTTTIFSLCTFQRLPALYFYFPSILLFLPSPLFPSPVLVPFSSLVARLIFIRLFHPFGGPDEYLHTKSCQAPF